MSDIQFEKMEGSIPVRGYGTLYILKFKRYDPKARMFSSFRLITTKFLPSNMDQYEVLRRTKGYRKKLNLKNEAEGIQEAIDLAQEELRESTEPKEKVELEKETPATPEQVRNILDDFPGYKDYLQDKQSSNWYKRISK